MALILAFLLCVFATLAPYSDAVECHDWTGWTPCSLTCGDGVYSRTRQCLKQGCPDFTPECVETDTESAPCSPSKKCPRQWAKWNLWDGVCEGFQTTQKRARSCPPAAGRGPYCPGMGSEFRRCPACATLFPKQVEFRIPMSYPAGIDLVANIPTMEGNLLGIYLCQYGYVILGDVTGVVCDPSSNPLGGALPAGFVLAPYWSGLNISNDGTSHANKVWADIYTPVTARPNQDIIIEEVNKRIHRHTGWPEYDAVYTMIVTWDEVIPTTAPLDPATFQLVITTDGTKSYAIFLYQKHGMLWDRTVDDVTVGVNYVSFENSESMNEIAGSAKYEFDKVRGNGGPSADYCAWVYEL